MARLIRLAVCIDTLFIKATDASKVMCVVSLLNTVMHIHWEWEGRE